MPASASPSGLMDPAEPLALFQNRWLIQPATSVEANGAGMPLTVLPPTKLMPTLSAVTASGDPRAPHSSEASVNRLIELFIKGRRICALIAPGTAPNCAPG